MWSQWRHCCLLKTSQSSSVYQKVQTVCQRFSGMHKWKSFLLRKNIFLCSNAIFVLIAPSFPLSVTFWTHSPSCLALPSQPVVWTMPWLPSSSSLLLKVCVPFNLTLKHIQAYFLMYHLFLYFWLNLDLFLKRLKSDSSESFNVCVVVLQEVPCWVLFFWPWPHISPSIL